MRERQRKQVFLLVMPFGNRSEMLVSEPPRNAFDAYFILEQTPPDGDLLSAAGVWRCVRHGTDGRSVWRRRYRSRQTVRTRTECSRARRARKGPKLLRTSAQSAT